MSEWLRISLKNWKFYRNFLSDLFCSFLAAFYVSRWNDSNKRYFFMCFSLPVAPKKNWKTLFLSQCHRRGDEEKLIHMKSFHFRHIFISSSCVCLLCVSICLWAWHKVASSQKFHFHAVDNEEKHFQFSCWKFMSHTQKQLKILKNNTYLNCTIFAIFGYRYIWINTKIENFKFL